MSSPLTGTLTRIALLACALAAPTAQALERGDTCTLKAPLAITVKQKSGTLESVVEAGTAVEVVGVSDGSARIRAGEIKGDVSKADLEGACSGTLRVCRLESPVVMYEQNRSDSKSWRVKAGAEVSVLKKGKTWAAVRVGDLRGFVKTDEITASCVAEAGRPALTDTDATAVVEEVERGEGPGVLFLPFALEGAAPAGNADALLDALYDRGASYRPDAARLPLEDNGKRSQDWKALVALGAKRARGAATAYVIVGRLSMEPPKPDKPLEERHLLQLGVVDAKTGNVLKAVRIRPTLDRRDNWADKALASLLPSIAAAPDSRLPVLGGEGGFEVAPVKDAPASAAPKKAEAPATTSDRLASILNPWGWLTLAGAAALGVTSGYVGSLALDENQRANDLSGADPEQAERRDTALTEAVTADALGVAAVGVGVAGVFVFATRAGIGE